MNIGRGLRVMVVLAVLCAVGAGPVSGAKPGTPPPPSGKSVYYTTDWSPVDGFGSAWKMASDGSGKTSLSGSMGRRMSDVRYGNTWWTVDVFQCAVSESRTPEGYARYKVMVAPVETGGTPFELVDDGNVNPFSATFRPGSTPRVTYVAVVWDAGTGEPSAGLWQVAFGTDGSVGDPELLMECETFNGWANPDYRETVAQMTFHDWFDESTLVCGDDAYDGWPTGNSLWAQLYVGDIGEDKGYHTALIAENQPRMGFTVQFNPAGSKVLYNNIYGLYEVSTAGNSTPKQWVANKDQLHVGNSDYLDDGTVVYEWGGYSGRSWFQDIYKLKLGSTKTNLTGDTSAWCSLGGAR